MPVVASSAYPSARSVTQLLRSLLNDANVGASLPIFIASAVRNGNVVTVTTVGPHGVVAGTTPDQVTIVGVTGGATSFNGVFSVASVVSPYVFTYAQAGGNESANASTGTMANVGQGAVWTDGVAMPYVNEGYRKVQRALKNVGQPGPIVDDYLLIVAAIPANPGPDPSVQVSITNSTAPPNQLPVDLAEPLRLWERPSGSSQPFAEMSNMTDQGGLPSQMQDTILHMWEWRGDGLWFVGATQDTQIRMRYRAFFAALTDGTSQILIRDSVSAIAYAAAGLAAASRGSPAAQQWEPLFSDAMEDLINAATRQLQRRGKRRRPFSSRAGYSSF